MAEPTRYCTNCGYALEAITSPQCPECGTPFEHTIPFTYSEESPEAIRGRDLKRRLSCLAAFAALYAIPRFVLISWIGPALGCWGILAWLLWIGALVLLILPAIDTPRVQWPGYRPIAGAVVGGLAAIPERGVAIAIAAFLGLSIGLVVELRRLSRE